MRHWRALLRFFPSCRLSAMETTARKRLGKIAMEEHFIVPEFMGYFAEITQTSVPTLRSLPRRR